MFGFPLPFWLLRMAGGVRSFFTAAIKWLFSDTRHLAIAALLCILAFGGCELRSTRMDLLDAKATIAKMDKARRLATFKAQLQKARLEYRIKQLSKETDDAIALSLAAERRGVDAFIAAGGVRDDRVCPGRSLAASSDRGAGNDAAMRPPPVLDGDQRVPSNSVGLIDPPTVRVFAEDVRICTHNTILAEQWRLWGLKLEAETGGGD
ncbi:MAG: hypothetical protein AAFP79_04910 [Pseudomonadota bacterium]